MRHPECEGRYEQIKAARAERMVMPSEEPWNSPMKATPAAAASRGGRLTSALAQIVAAVFAARVKA